MVNIHNIVKREIKNKRYIAAMKICRQALGYSFHTALLITRRPKSDVSKKFLGAIK